MVTAKDTTGEFVDLGLSVKWASGNIVKDGTKYSIGTTTDRGCYFSWGNVEGHNMGEGYDFSENVYNSTPGHSLTADISATGGYDAARVTLGGNWRLPTKAECEELINNCTWTWTTQDGVNGMKLTSKKSGYTDNSIFIPASGGYNGTSLGNDGSLGGYWSSTWNSSSNTWGLYFNSLGRNMNARNRSNGFTVRGVMSYIMDTNVLFYNTASSQYKVFNINEFPSNDLGWTPIAIEVVPPSHNRYGDGSGGYMSLGGISERGTIQTNGANENSYVIWGPYGSDVASLANYETVDESSYTYGYIHFQTNSESTSCSFYGTPNIQYPYTELNGTEKQTYTAGCLKDYDGVGNTNELNDPSHRAAYACKQVSTIGTSKGDWYLPSAGEIAYLPSIRFEANKTISSLQLVYGNVGSLLNTQDTYWSSNECNYNYAWYVNLNDGLIGYNFKDASRFVRAFLRFNPATSTIVR